jgi:hypothetical protein
MKYDLDLVENKIMLSFNIERLEEKIKSLDGDGEHKTAAKPTKLWFVHRTQEKLLESLVKLAACSLQIMIKIGSCYCTSPDD